MNECLCASCTQSIYCDTWSEWKCRAKEKRIYNYKTITNCEYYKKRDKNFKEPKCQCENCLENELIYDICMED